MPAWHKQKRDYMKRYCDCLYNIMLRITVWCLIKMCGLE
jgi:hypothetical protein